MKAALAAGSAPVLFNGCATGFLACRKINIGVVGFGRIAHSMDIPNTIKYTDLCRFVAICDLDATRREAGDFGLEAPRMRKFLEGLPNGNTGGRNCGCSSCPPPFLKFPLEVFT